jgi:hypothetical protein
VIVDTLFPRPKRVTELDGGIWINGRAIEAVYGGPKSPLVIHAIEMIQRPGNEPYRLSIDIGADNPAWPAGETREEAYTLELAPDGGWLRAATPAGVFVGAQTVRALLDRAGEQLPALRITDWPDLRYRGLYVESKWGPDLMTLEDWQAAIDDMAARKFNSLGIGVYGCWVVQYGGKRTEFMMLPFPDHPGLETPKTIRYFSPAADAWQTLDYLPRMATDDLFGEIVAYANERNIIVRPHFNSPGHNTVIPRAFPETASLDEAGAPIGYGFCLSNPRTYEVLFELYDSVIERYLRPNGIEWFHIGLDEVDAYLGIDEADPTRSVDPWCRCPLCRDRPHALQLQEYAIRVCRHLKDQGIIHITMWNDALDHLGALDETFVRMVDEAGLRENVIVQWWRYNQPVLVPRPELGLRAWSTPMAGYWPNLFMHGYTSNIYGMLVHGGRAGIEGADAYVLYDPGFDRNYACLAEFAWNQPGNEDIYGFRSRYSQALLGPYIDRHLAAEAFDTFDQAFDSMPWTRGTLSSLLYYWHTYPAARMTGSYPRDLFPELAESHFRLRQGLAAAALHARKARDLFTEANREAREPRINELRAECDKLVGVWDAFSGVVDVIVRYRAIAESGGAGSEAAAAVAEIAAKVRTARERFVGVMADLEQVKAAYLRPQILRDMSIGLLYIERLGDELSELSTNLGNGTIDVLPAFADLAINQIELDPYVSTAADPQPVA